MNALTVDAVFFVLDAWVKTGWIRRLDRAFAQFLHDEALAAQQPANPLLLLFSALLSHQCGRGHVCLPVADLLKNANLLLALPPENSLQKNRLQEGPVPEPSQLLAQVTDEDCRQALHHTLLVAEGNGNTPLVFDEGRLYLRRYWQYEQTIKQSLQHRLQAARAVDEALLKTVLQQLFPDSNQADSVNWQKIACALAVRSNFSIITGGPGTGKTTTVVKLLAALQWLTQETEQRLLHIRMAAPTGKAAARLNNSISMQLDTLRQQLTEKADIVDSITPNVCTLHRLLGTIPRSRHFRHNANHYLLADVVVIDEASMVDIEMMSNLLSALKPSTKLILLGDKDQLASVEAGAVLGQWCQRADAAHYTHETARWLQTVTGCSVPENYIHQNGHALDQAITMLRHSYRFGEQSGIGQLAHAVNAGCVDTVQSVLQAAGADVSHLRVLNTEDSGIDQLLLKGYRNCWEAVVQGPNQQTQDEWAKQVLEKLTGFQILCAVRQGDWGVAALNQRAEKILRSHRLLGDASEWYVGRPVMVTRNDYNLQLMNGDMGITLLDENQQLRVVFADSEKPGGVRWVLPARLTEVETVFAMTVHKSQGSEFAHAALVLPDHTNPVLTRELFYTGITRAAKQFTLLDSSNDVLRQCVLQCVQREGGALVAQ